MTTTATHAESVESDATSAAECLALQRGLVHAALELMRRLPLTAHNSVDLLRLGATCISIAAEQAFGERDERRAVHLWAQCDAGERQVRSATYHALRNNFIKNRLYDELFAIANQARRARRSERDRLRRRLRQLALI
jgi:hypothetical protein